jgi:hypothetical protein
MKRVIVVDDLREFEIRPQDDLNEYIALLERDVARIFGHERGVLLTRCPACGAVDAEPAFEKLGFQYLRCGSCRSLYVSPRPTYDMLRIFYMESEAVEFWNSTLVHRTADARRAHIFQPRVAWIVATAESHGHLRGTFVDYYPKYRAFLEGIAAMGRFERYVVMSPWDLFPEGLVPREFTVLDSLPDGTASVISALEVIERAHDLSALLGRLWALLEQGGLLFATTLTSSGFDVQILGPKARNLLPPTHLNVLTVEGITTLLERCGFEIRELSTPGQLDVELVLNALREEPAIELPVVIDDLIRRRDEHVQQVFQEFLQQACLSSHLRLVARKQKAGCLSLDRV